MDNLPTEQSSVQPVTPATPVVVPPAPTPTPAPTAPGTLPPPSSNKTIFIVVAAVIALVLSYLGYAMMSAPSATEEDEKISAAPPSLSMPKSGLKGSFSDVDSEYGFMDFNETDIKNFKAPTTDTTAAELESGANYVYTTRDMTWKEIAQNIDPVAKKAFLAYYDTAKGKFRVYPKGPFDGTLTVTEPDLSTEKIPTGRGLIVISRLKSRAYGLANAKTKPTTITPVDPKLQGWILLPVKESKIKEAAKIFNGMDKTIFAQKSATEFEKVTNRDTHELKDFNLVWVYLKKADSVGGGSGGGSTETAKTTTIKTNSLKPITLNATGVTTTQTQDVTLEGENLDAVDTITSSDSGIAVKSIVVTATKITFKVEVSSTTAAGDKVLTINGKDGKPITTLKVTASAPATTTLSAPKITSPANNSTIDVTKDLVLAWEAVTALPAGTTAVYIPDVMEGVITSSDKFKQTATSDTDKTTMTMPKDVVAKVFLPGKSYTLGVKVSAIDSAKKSVLTSDWSLVTLSVAAATSATSATITKVIPEKLVIPTAAVPVQTTIPGTLTGTNLSAVSKITSTDADLNVTVEKAEDTSVTFKITHTKLTAGEKTFTALDKDSKVIATFKIPTDPAGTGSTKPVITSISPKSATQSQKDVNFNINGSNLKDAKVEFSPASEFTITQNATVNINNDVIVLKATIADNATLGLKEIKVTTNAGSVVDKTFEIKAKPAQDPLIGKKVLVQLFEGATPTNQWFEATVNKITDKKYDITFTYGVEKGSSGVYSTDTTKKDVGPFTVGENAVAVPADATYLKDEKNLNIVAQYKGSDATKWSAVLQSMNTDGTYKIMWNDDKSTTDVALDKIYKILGGKTYPVTVALGSDEKTTRDMQRLVDLQKIANAIDTSYTANKKYPDDVATTFAIPGSLSVPVKDSTDKPYYYHNIKNECYVLGALMETTKYGNTGLESGKTIADYIGGYGCKTAEALKAGSGLVALVFKNAPAPATKPLTLKTADDAPLAPEKVAVNRPKYSIKNLTTDGIGFSFTDSNVSSYLEDRNEAGKYLINYRFAITTQNDDPDNTPWKSGWESDFPTGDSKCATQVTNHVDDKNITVWTCTKGTIKITDTSKFKNAIYVLHVWAGDGRKESTPGESQIFEVTGVPVE